MCTKTVMDTTDPDIFFDENGICNYYHYFNKEIKPILESSASKDSSRRKLVQEIKTAGKHSEYDCVIGVSGGVDSSYLAYYLKRIEGLRPLAVHLDGGWNSELAVKNIENLLKVLDIDLYTHVIDWREMRDVHVAFLKSGVANQDIPQDHAIVAILFKIAREHGIRYIIGGQNLSTESILPQAWGHNLLDSKHLKSIHKKFGQIRLKTYPIITLFYYHFVSRFIHGIKLIRFLNFIEYDKDKAMHILENELGWKYYGGKHYESRFTKFFQSYFLPTRFGYDKRKAHLSSMILSGQITRDEALKELEKPLYNQKELEEDKEYILKKLELSSEEFEELMNMPRRTHKDYPSNDTVYQFVRSIYLFLKRFRLKSL